MNCINADKTFEFFSMLNKYKIDYILIKNIVDELPFNLGDGKDIDILVNLESKVMFEKMMIDNNFEKCIHPFGIENGWAFYYFMPSHQYWIRKLKNSILYINVGFMICCMSLIPKVWIPIKELNSSVWLNKIFDKKYSWWIIDDRNLLLYLMIKFIFDKNDFSDFYIKQIEIRKHLLHEIKDKMHIVFYNFSPRLSEMVMAGKYSDIIHNYTTFNEY